MRGGSREDRRVLSSGHPDTAGESEIRKSSFCRLYSSSAAVLSLCYPFLFTSSTLVSHSPPIRSHETDKWRLPTLARTKDSFEAQRRISVHRRSLNQRIHLTIRTFNLSSETALLLFPRLDEINSYCLRVFATSRINPFRDCSISYFCLLVFIREFYEINRRKLKWRKDWNIEFNFFSLKAI